MKRSLIIAAALILAGLQGAKAEDCNADAIAAANKCLVGVNINVDYEGMARCKAAGAKAKKECEAVNTFQAHKPDQRQPGNQPISRPGHIVPDLSDPAKLGTPENDD